MNKIKVGEVYCFPINQIHFGAVRILQIKRQEILGAISNWIEPTKPTIADPAISQILQLTAEPSLDPGRPTPADLRHRMAVYWISKKPAPDNFEFVGLIEPSAADKLQTSRSFTSFQYLATIVEKQRLWDTDKKAYEDFVTSKALESHRRHLEMQKQQAATLTMDKLLKQKFCSSWKGVAPPAVIKIYRTTIAQAIKIIAQMNGENVSKEKKIEFLRDKIEELAHVNANFAYFLDTTEREEVLEIFDKLCILSGIDQDLKFEKYF